MKIKFLLALTMMATHPSLFAHVNVVYGEDNRKDIYEVSNPLHLKLAKATAGMISLGEFENAAGPHALKISRAQSLEESLDICPTEAFSQQPTAPSCTSFLVGPDLMVSAGHCFAAAPDLTCKFNAWVFDYHMSGPDHNPAENIPKENIYLCSEVLAYGLNEQEDYVIFKLDRKVEGRTPLDFRKTDKVLASTPLLVIGHPSGLPTKVDEGGRITHNSLPTLFSASLDTFHGSSGSPVLDAKTGMVEGILIQGKADYIAKDPEDPLSCQVVNRCQDDGTQCDYDDFFEEDEFHPTQKGEVVFRISTIASLIQKALKLP